MTCATARSVVSSRPWAASQGMSREASHCWADAWSTSSPTSSAQIASRRLSAQWCVGAPVSGTAPSGANPARGSGSGGRLRRASQRCAALRDVGGGGASRGGSGPARILAEVPRRIATTCPSARLIWSIGSWPASRAQPGSSSATARDGVLTSRTPPGATRSNAAASRTSRPPPSSSARRRPGGLPAGGRRSREQRLFSHRRLQRRVPLAIPGIPASHSLELHRRAQAGVVVVHRQQRLRPPLRYLAVH